MNTDNNYINDIKKHSKLFYVFTVLSILMPILAITIPWIPQDETLATWFQRSGSAMIVFALLAEAKAIEVHNILNPSGFVGLGFDDAQSKYYKHPAMFNLSSFTLIALGTLIWGYGDIPLKNV
ncbi:hypothetical protein SOPP22_14205 [Shewanella sp. OPT22]|nr:hypothetical protein SOPP22_14205 [Shewanella sp. OPT22]